MSNGPETARAISPSLLLRLPRELRDQIYKQVLTVEQPLPIRDAYAHQIFSIFWKQPTLLAEALEIFYKVNTFVLDLEVDEQASPSETWGPYPHVKQHIRSLVVHCKERTHTSPERAPIIGVYHTEIEKQYRTSHDRRRWEQLLEIPALQKLNINMQKTSTHMLSADDFGPIVYELRARNPAFQVDFLISLDDMLKDLWNAPWWQQFNHAPILTRVTGPADDVADSYQPMGYTDVSYLMEPPSEADLQHVAEYFPEEGAVSRPRLVQQFAPMGLLDEEPHHRRQLAGSYIVREPELFRCLMNDRYETYKKIRQQRPE